MKKYLIYDARYWTEPDRATVFEVCDTKKEAERNKSVYGDDCVVVEEEVEFLNPNK